MQIEQMAEVLIQPKMPIDTDLKILHENQTKLNIQFPDDFIKFSSQYGSGIILGGGQSIQIYSGCRLDYSKILDRFFYVHDEYRKAIETFDLTLGLFPEKGGLFPFGKDSNGTWFCWDTSKQPNHWTIVIIWDYEEDGFERHECRFLDFLHGLLTQKREHRLWGTSWAPQLPVKYDSIVYT